MAGGMHARLSGRAGPNPLPPRHLSTPERLDELCALLALGLVRLRRRDRETSAAESGYGLHSAPDRSGHATPTRRRPA